jgi:deoxyhypusine synthase
MEQDYEIDPKHSWMLAAAEKNLPIVVPGREDSTRVTSLLHYCIKGELKPTTVKGGIEYMMWLADWYRKNSSERVSDSSRLWRYFRRFPYLRCSMMYQGPRWHDVPFWSYFCQISIPPQSYGSYSGAVPNEKITWGKLDINTPKFIIESDATRSLLRSSLPGLLDW